MSSTGKTQNLKLNIWSGSDKPKREDFNYDNEAIDAAISNHTSNSDIHLSDDERARLTQPFVIGSYTGDGTNSRTFQLGFTPSLLIVYANAIPTSVYDKANDKMYSFGGFATSQFASAGIFIEENRFVVTDTTGVPTLSNYYPRMNTSNYRYQYIAFK